ncbi:MAG: prephenate dehydrogenase/arogenate dehydrogenase family protein [Lachnospiraceae bacterium]|nr:prephenate dehydrogenase/arogenate dehydrogenase family protein [Lachnospiraceae bacterium]
MKKLAFIGFGLIGASIAKALKTKCPGEYEIKVYDHHTTPSEALLTAKSDGMVDAIYSDIESVLDCDFLFLCAPTLRNIEYLSTIKKLADEKGLTLPFITDAGSVKGNISEAAKSLGLEKVFLGGHPMAGSEKTGYLNATSHMLENAYYILTPSYDFPDDALTDFEEIVKKTGAIPVILEADEHDRITAAISHVPHLVAVELVNLVMNAGGDTEKMKLLAAGGFKDITRIASSSPEMWRSIFLSNKDAVVAALEKLEDALVRAEAAIISGDGDYIAKDFKEAGEFRAAIPDTNGMYRKSHRIFLDVEDEVGIIARIAGILTESNISIKNIGIVHNRASDPGALRIDFYAADAKDSAAEVLKNSGYTVYLRD